MTVYFSLEDMASVGDQRSASGESMSVLKGMAIVKMN